MFLPGKKHLLNFAGFCFGIILFLPLLTDAQEPDSNTIAVFSFEMDTLVPTFFGFNDSLVTRLEYEIPTTSYKVKALSKTKSQFMA